MLVLYTFLVIYNPPIFPFSTLHLCTVFALFSIISHWRDYRNRFMLHVRNSVIFLSLVMVYMLFIILIGEGSIVELYRLGAIAFELIPCACFISYYSEKKHLSIEKCIIMAAFIEGLIATISFFVPSVQSLLIGNMIRNGYSDVFKICILSFIWIEL